MLTAIKTFVVLLSISAIDIVKSLMSACSKACLCLSSMVKSAAVLSGHLTNTFDAVQHAAKTDGGGITISLCIAGPLGSQL